MCVPCLPTILDWTMSIITIIVCAYEPDGCVNQGVTQGIRVIAILTIVVHVLEITIQCFVKDGEAFNYNPPNFQPQKFLDCCQFYHHSFDQVHCGLRRHNPKREAFCC